jgi:hypothetical protein
LDEDVYFGVAQGLRRRGFDILTTIEAGRTGSTDEDQLFFAASQGRSIFTFNRGHFAELHSRILAEGKHHFGIIVSRQLNVGAVVRMVSAFLSSRRSDDLKDQLFWISTAQSL